MAGMPAAISTTGGTKKPFSYCPGGIDFSELKSPKMQRRIAKHQSGMSAASSTPPSAPATIMATPPSTPRQSIQQTNTLPSYSTGSTPCKPKFGRQRSISDLLSTPCDTPAPSTLPQVNSSPVYTYNPYSADRSISIPPPTPPPIIPQQPIDPVNRANSLPPGASIIAPARNTTTQHQNKVSSGKPGLPPPHPVHQLLQSQAQNNETSVKSTMLPSPSNLNNVSDQHQSYEQPIKPQNCNPALVNPKGIPPPPPPPPPPSLGVVAKCGPAGVPFAGKKSVRATISLADIRAGNSNLGPDPEQENTQKGALTLDGVDNSFTNKQQSDFTSSETSEPILYPILQSQQTSEPSISTNNFEQPQEAKTKENGFAESLNEFEAQRNAMMSPPIMSRNTNNFPDLKIDSSVSKESGSSSGNQISSSLPQTFDDFYSNANTTQLPLSVIELNNKTIPRNTISIDLQEQNFKSDKDNILEKSPEIIHPKHNSPMYETESKPKLNDDIKMTTARERSLPRQQSLQRDCEGHNVTPNAYVQEAYDMKPKSTMQTQNSIDKDEQELIDINKHSGRRESHGSVRYRPETPRTVTPVRFSATPKLPNKGLSRQKGVQDKQQNSPLPPKPSENTKPIIKLEDVKMNSQEPSRNVSDSGISVNSSTPEPDETAGKIVTESMQKIEAQMKKILESENQQQDTNVAEKLENSESTSSVNSFNQTNDSSKAESICSTGNDITDPTPSTYSGYSTCSEEELKFEEPKINIPLKTAPFEVMEDFEEAPEEFDLGISSYSISHPVENEEMEKTPVPEVFDNCEETKQDYEATPYRVSPPSRNGTLEFEKKASSEKDLGSKYSQVPHIQQPHCYQKTPEFPHQQYPQPQTPKTPVNNPFNQMNLPNMGLPMNMPNMMGMPPMPPMFDESFTPFPNMFEQPFQPTDMFAKFPNQPVSTAFQHKPQQDEVLAKERIIPIQVVNMNSQNLMNNVNYTNQNRQTQKEDQRPVVRTIEVPIKVESYDPKRHVTTPQYSLPTCKSSQNQKIPTPPTPPPISQSVKLTPVTQQNWQNNISNTLPARNRTISPQTVKYGTTTPSGPRNGQLSPTPSMLQSQLSQLQSREKEQNHMPARNQSVEDQRPSFNRSASSSDNIKGRLVQKPKTPTYNELQFRYGNKHSPSPVLDKDYQKEARQTVVGELSSYGGVQQASQIAGQRKKPSQSPSMRLLGMLHVHDDPDDPVSEYTAASRQYTGDQGRFMPPRFGQPLPDSSGNYLRSLSSQL